MCEKEYDLNMILEFQCFKLIFQIISLTPYIQQNIGSVLIKNFKSEMCNSRKNHRKISKLQKKVTNS